MADNSPEIIALAGNPNVGKSTIFNALTGMKQHTGNWPGKTVLNAQGTCTFHEHCYTFVDIPGCYSLMHTPQRRKLPGILSVSRNRMPLSWYVTPPVWNGT